MFVLLGTGFVVAAETDDSSLFVEAFSAYQRKDYLLTIEKIGVIDQLFPDTPLRDVTLLLLARSGLKSGDNELAATTINRFSSEFPAHPLTSTIEAELLLLGIRYQQGERLPPAIPLRTAAQKVRNEQIALERAAAEKSGQGRMAEEKSGAGLRERKRRASAEAAQENAGTSISLPGGMQTVAVGQRGEIPFVVTNRGTTDEDIVLETSAPPGYEALLRIDGRSDERLTLVKIGTVAPLKGSIMFRMPPDRIDGHKATITLRAASEKDPHIVRAVETQITTAAPLVRAIAKPDIQRLAPGETTRYRITVLNAGSLPALGITVRVLLPAQLDSPGRVGTPYLRDAAGGIVFRMEKLESGKLSELILDVKVREDAPFGQELRSMIEVINPQLQTKEIFTSAAVTVQGDRPLPAPVNRP